jgi:glycosyltransferase involved in cell wall biosynthesis
MRWYGYWVEKGSYKTIKDIHAKTPIDVIDAHYVYPDGRAAVAIAKSLGVPVIVSARGTDLTLYPRFRKIRPLLKATLEKCDHVICVCSELKNVALELGTPSPRISVIGNGINGRTFKPVDRCTARKALRLPLNRRLVLSVGSLTKNKGFHLLIEAFADLKDPDLLLAIVGSGPEKERLQSLATDLGLSGRLIMPGIVLADQILLWYNAADLFVLASAREGWPNVVSEAQAIGLPVVATKVWGIPEIVTDESLGILIEERTALALRQAIGQALRKTWNRSHIATIGARRTWDQVSQELNQIFSKYALYSPS